MALMAAGLVTLVVHQNRPIRQLQAELVELRAPPPPPPTLPEAPVAPAPPSEELLRLRGEVARLRSQQPELDRLRTENSRLRNVGARVETSPQAGTEDPDPERAAAKQRGIARLNYAKGWGLALVQFANANNGLMPARLADAGHLFPAEAESAELTADQFEIVYKGALKDLAEPAKTIIVREKEPWATLRRPGASRTYLFADGHSEIHYAADGTFDQWEQEHLGAR